VSAADPSTPEPLAGGRLNAAVSTAVVRIHREFYGKGPTKARTYSFEDLVVCVLRDVLTTAERTLIGAGRGDSARDVRVTFQDTMMDEFTSAVEQFTGRRVIGFFSQVDVQADMAVEVFVLDRPLEQGVAQAEEATPAA
jgi:uncharacterized protein YbcI